MIKPGSTMTMYSGRQIVVGEELSCGAEFRVFHCREKRSGEPGILKVLQPDQDKEAFLERTCFLIEQALPHPPIAAPVDYYHRGRVAAHVAPLAAGVNLEDYLHTAEVDLVDGLQVGAAAAVSLRILEDRGIAHGDIHSRNFKVQMRDDGVQKMGAIDVDNFARRGLPLPQCFGQELYLAPELRNGWKTGIRIAPTLESDRFAFAVLTQEVLLRVHPAKPWDTDRDAVDRVMMSGVWPTDPMHRTWQPTDPGFPAAILSPSLCNLFRRGFSDQPAQRPSFREWVNVLMEALLEVGICPFCGGAFVIDRSKDRCPYPDCQKCFPPLAFLLRDGRTLPIERQSLTLGRANLGGSPYVSAQHTILTRYGPALQMEALGSNGTFRWEDDAWVLLQPGRQVLLRAGDRIRFADVETLLTVLD